jgi:hypothetical protein
MSAKGGWDVRLWVEGVKATAGRFRPILQSHLALAAISAECCQAIDVERFLVNFC